MTLADRLDRALARPTIAWGIMGAVVAVHALVGLEQANIAISYLTLALLLALYGSQRRDRLAMHGKLDELVDAVPDARSELAHLEDQAEAAIQEMRK